MNILEYTKGKDSLENKEKLVRDTINKLDKESFELYKEILDLSNVSYYKLMNLYLRTNKLALITKDVVEASDNIDKTEESNFDYATRRYQLKKLLICSTTLCTFLINALLGIFTFVLLSKKANKDYADELSSIYDSMEVLDESKIKLIVTTLQNCERLLGGKENKIAAYLDEVKDDNEMFDIVISNEIIARYIADEIDFEKISQISEGSKKYLINVLQRDLNSANEDLFELLELAKTKNSNGLKLIMDYENN